MAACNVTSICNESTCPRIDAYLVNNPQERQNFLSSLFGSYYIRGERIAFAWMHEICSQYNGEPWLYYRLSNGGFYMKPIMRNQYVTIKLNHFKGKMSVDGAGIVCSVLALRYLAYTVEKGRDHLNRNLLRLFSFISCHPEDGSIRSATQ